MDRLGDIETFIAVAEAGGFSPAARHLGRAQATISRQIQTLERRLGNRLVARTTRRVALTEAGERFLVQARQVLADLAEAERAAMQDARRPSGLLRATCASSFGRRHVAPLLAAFRAEHPGITIDLDLDDRYVDLVQAGIDLAIRLGPPEATGLVARRLTATRLVLCAAPGVPPLSDPSDLAGRDALVLDVYAGRDRWPFTRGSETRMVQARAAIRINDAEAIRAAALAGAGITVLPDYLIGPDLAAGRLVELLPDWRLPSLPIMLVLPERRLTSRRVRLFVDFLAARLGGGDLRL
jgi:DNA-binding transcriptional LysR family regulator